MAGGEALERGRSAFARQAWGEAHAQLAAADAQTPLDPEDLERLAVAAHLVGRDDDSVRAWERAHRALLDAGDVVRAVRCAFWLGFGLLYRGETARGGGWMARAQRLLGDAGAECVEQGLVLLPIALRHVVEGDFTSAHTAFTQAVEIGTRFADADLVTYALHGQGRVLLRLGDTAAGAALFDEAMVAVTAGEVSPIVAGTVYCGVIEACQEVFDSRRAHEWTAALSDWCASQPDLVPYRGLCLVHRSEILQLCGEWPEAMDEVRRACKWLAEPAGQPALGAAFYQQGELHRLRGEFAQAEEAFGQASRFGRQPQPGLALLRVAQGRLDAAEAAIRHVVAQTGDRVLRARLLAAHVEIMLAAGDVPAARASADELAEIAAGLDAPLLAAVSAHAAGAVLVTEGDPHSALSALRQAWTVWCELEAPYEAARVRVLLGLACRQLGDEDTARFELDAARGAFAELGAVPDLAKVDALLPAAAAPAKGGLTAREIEVLALVARGTTNREIAAALVISEHTVARHVQNIFAKLDVSSRTAAGAFAFEHDLL